jgi:hypothetical protein
MLYALKLKFEEEQERRVLEEERLAQEKLLQRLEAQRIADEKRRAELLKISEEMSKNIIQRAFGAASVGQDTIVVDLGNLWEYAFHIIQGIRREIPDICINVHEYDKSEAVGGIFSNKLKSISVSWKPGSGRGQLG